jgi:hypothetical protein
MTRKWFVADIALSGVAELEEPEVCCMPPYVDMMMSGWQQLFLGWINRNCCGRPAYWSGFISGQVTLADKAAGEFAQLT